MSDSNWTNKQNCIPSYDSHRSMPRVLHFIAQEKILDLSVLHVLTEFISLVFLVTNAVNNSDGMNSPLTHFRSTSVVLHKNNSTSFKLMKLS